MPCMAASHISPFGLPASASTSGPPFIKSYIRPLLLPPQPPYFNQANSQPSALLLFWARCPNHAQTISICHISPHQSQTVNSKDYTIPNRTFHSSTTLHTSISPSFHIPIQGLGSLVEFHAGSICFIILAWKARFQIYQKLRSGLYVFSSGTNNNPHVLMV